MCSSLRVEESVRKESSRALHTMTLWKISLSCPKIPLGISCPPSNANSPHSAKSIQLIHSSTRALLCKHITYYEAESGATLVKRSTRTSWPGWQNIASPVQNRSDHLHGRRYHNWQLGPHPQGDKRWQCKIWGNDFVHRGELNTSTSPWTTSWSWKSMRRRRHDQQSTLKNSNEPIASQEESYQNQFVVTLIPLTSRHCWKFSDSSTFYKGWNWSCPQRRYGTRQGS